MLVENFTRFLVCQYSLSNFDMVKKQHVVDKKYASFVLRWTPAVNVGMHCLGTRYKTLFGPTSEMIFVQEMDIAKDI